MMCFPVLWPGSGGSSCNFLARAVTVKLTFDRQNTRTGRESTREVLMTHRSWGCTAQHVGRSRQGTGRERVRGVLWGFWARAGSVNLSQKEQGFGQLCRGSLGVRGTCLSQGLQESYTKTFTDCDSAGIVGHVRVGGAGAGPKPLQAAWLHSTDTEAATL